MLLTAKEIGIRVITWSGGEFILRRDAVELVRRATDYGYESTVCTNATRMTRDRLEELQEASGRHPGRRGRDQLDRRRERVDPQCRRRRDARGPGALRRDRHPPPRGRQRRPPQPRDPRPTFQWLEDHGISYNRSPYTARGCGRGYWDEMAFDREDLEETFHPALRSSVTATSATRPSSCHRRSTSECRAARRTARAPEPADRLLGRNLAGHQRRGRGVPCGILLDEVSCGNVRDGRSTRSSTEPGVPAAPRSRQAPGQVRPLPLPVHLRRLPRDGLVPPGDFWPRTRPASSSRSTRPPSRSTRRRPTGCSGVTRSWPASRAATASARRGEREEMRMGPEEMESKARAILARIAQREPQELAADQDLVADLGIDSPKALELLCDLEDECGIEVPDDFVGKMNTVGDVLLMLRSVEPAADSGAEIKKSESSQCPRGHNVQENAISRNPRGPDRRRQRPGVGDRGAAGRGRQVRHRQRQAHLRRLDHAAARELEEGAARALDPARSSSSATPSARTPPTAR